MIHGSPGGEGAREYEVGVELPGRARQLQVAPKPPGGHDGRVLDKGYTRRIEATASSRMGEHLGHRTPLWTRTPGVEKRRGRLCGSLRDGRGGAQKSDHMLTGDTRDVRGEEVYVEPFSLVLQHSATLVRCRGETPPRWRIGKERVCGYPEIRPCSRPGPLPRHWQGELREVTGTARPTPGGERIEVHPESVNGRDNGGGDLPQGTPDTLARAISNQWTKGYDILGPATATAGVVMMGVSAMEMVASTITRAAVLYARKGPGLWILVALWGTAFQVIVMPTQCALEWGEMQGSAVSRHILSRVGGANLPADGGGPAAFN
jgi:hypothetical protein